VSRVEVVIRNHLDFGIMMSSSTNISLSKCSSDVSWFTITNDVFVPMSCA
jgi:hypothetical protein